MTVSAALTSETLSLMESQGKTVGKIRSTFIWETSDAHTAQTLTLANLNGFIEAVSVNISSVTGNPTTDITLTDANSAIMVTISSLTDGTKHYKDEGDFGIIPVDGDVVISVDPSADPGGTAQTLTIIIDLKLTRRR